MSILDYDFMVRALIAALLIGLTAPAVGIYLVQRRMSLMGDGLGHIALTGVAAGFLLGTQPLWTAVIATALGAVAVELLRSMGGTSGDVALALLFYGGIAGGVLLLAFSDATSVNLMSYLFGSLLTTTVSELWLIGLLGAGVLAVTLGLRPLLFATSFDSEHARVSGIPVLAINVLVALTAAVTVTVGMRVVGVLLVSALMVVPVATAERLARGFTSTLLISLLVGIIVAVGGATASYHLDSAPGATIVVGAIALFAVVLVVTSVISALRRRADAS